MTYTSWPYMSPKQIENCAIACIERNLHKKGIYVLAGYNSSMRSYLVENGIKPSTIAVKEIYWEFISDEFSEEFMLLYLRGLENTTSLKSK